MMSALILKGASRSLTPKVCWPIVGLGPGSLRILWQWFRFSHTIRAGIGSGKIHSSFGVVQNGLPPAHERGVLLAHDQFVALVSQRLQNFGLDSGLDDDLAVNLIAGNCESWGFQRSLNVHAVVNKVGYELGVGQWLVGAAHDAEANMHVATFHECRNNRVEGPLARLQRIGTLWIKLK